MAPDYCMDRFMRLAALIVGVLLLPSLAVADNWAASIYEDAAPSRLVGVDKSRATFNFFEKKSPLRLRYSYPCVTGQIKGDKQQLNDLRTPEGVYFVEYKIANGLDFREYGGIAYTLNYPNPVDRLRGKTGYGIWIHSKGFGLVPTKGCVAIGLQNIHEVGPLLSPGTPVVVAEELKSISGEDSGELEELKKLMEEWSRAWAERSPRMFDFYDPDAYSHATENFSFFRQNKERLFKALSFIKIFNREIHALEGPGYWVTWSEQLYAASNLSTEGVRRLYWQKNDKGEFKIVGMEWTPRDVGMQAAYKEGKLVAQGPAATVTDATSEAPRPARLDMPEQPQESPAAPIREKGLAAAAIPQINKDVEASVAALSGEVAAVTEPLVPSRRPRIEQPDEIRWGLGRTLTNPEEKPADPPATVRAPIEIEETPEKDKVETSAIREDAQSVKAQLVQTLGQWLDAYRAQGDEIEKFYDKAKFNRIPNGPRGRSLNTTLQAVKRDCAQPWLEIIARPASVMPNGDIAQVEQELFFVTPAGARQGLQKTWWMRADDGEWKIIASDFLPRALGLEANYLEAVSGQIAQTLEAWRKAWEAGRLEDYLSYYTPDANQQGKAGQKTIRQQKERLWSRVKPALVQLSGLRLAMAPQGIRVDMNQTYADSSGHTDKGVKTLLLRFDGHEWRIQREDWTPGTPPVPATAIPG